MRAIKKLFEDEEDTEAEIRFIEICLTFGIVFVVISELARMVIR